MLAKIRVGIFDPEPLLRDGVVDALAADPEIEVVGEGSSFVDAMRFAAELRPQILLVEPDLPSGGFGALNGARAAFADVGLVVLTRSDREDDVVEAFSIGARGYVLKSDTSRELACIIRSIAAGKTYVSPSLFDRVLVAMQRWSAGAHEPAAREPGLSAREEQILVLAARGLTNKEVGRELQLSEKTVKNYMTGLMLKLHAKNRIEAMIAARRCGLVRAGQD